MILDDAATYLASNSTRFTVGVNLTKGLMPDSPDTVTTLFDTGGSSPLHTFTTSTGTRWAERPGLMIHARSADQQTARANAYAAFTLLDGIHDRGLPTTTGTHYVEIGAAQSPFLIGRDKNDRYLIGVNFDVAKSTG